MSDIIRDEPVELLDHGLSRAFACEPESLHDTHSRRGEEVECRHRTYDEIVLVDVARQWKEDLLHIPSILPHFSTRIPYEYESESERYD